MGLGGQGKGGEKVLLEANHFNFAEASPGFSSINKSYCLRVSFPKGDGEVYQDTDWECPGSSDRAEIPGIKIKIPDCC